MDNRTHPDQHDEQENRRYRVENLHRAIVADTDRDRVGLEPAANP
jgi:hypothetical protein